MVTVTETEISKVTIPSPKISQKLFLNDTVSCIRTDVKSNCST